MKRGFVRLCIASALLTMSGGTASTYDLYDDFVAKCVGIFNTCGYYRRQDGSEAIPPRFEDAMPFSEGLAAVQIDGLFGYIDRKGTTVIPPRFDLGGAFQNGLAEVVLDDHTGVIDRSGNLVLPARYGRSIPVSNHTVIVHDGVFESSRIDPFDFLLVLRQPAGLVDLYRGPLTEQKYKFNRFSRDGAYMWAKDATRPRQGRYGLMRADGKWQVTPAFDLVTPLREGRAPVAVANAPGTAGLEWGAVDDTGQLVIPPQFRSLSYWLNGYALAKNDEKEGFVDKQGHVLGGRFFDEVMRDGAERPAWVRVDRHWYAIDAAGTLGSRLEQKPNPIHHLSRDNSINPSESKSRKNAECSSGSFLYAQDGVWGLKGPDGKIIIPAKYEAIDCFVQGVAWAVDLSKRAWCPIGPDGEARIKPSCRQQYYPMYLSEFFPEKLADDAFLSNVLWMQAFLRYGIDPTQPPPKMIKWDEKSHSIEMRCRGFCRERSFQPVSP